MSRDIDFRGKDIKTGEWVYGFYFELEPLNESKKGYIVIGTENILSDNQIKILPVIKEVDINTVGQYIDLKDAKGQEVYEGDIILSPWWDDEPQEVKYYDYGFKGRDIRQEIVYGREYYEGIDELLDGCFGKDFNTIGNIHDNPELLEGER